jgi:lysophospholipase L1-like esterase
MENGTVRPGFFEKVGMISMSARHAVLSAIVVFAAGCGGTGGPAPDAGGAWVGTWSAAPQRVEDRNLPPAPGLAGNTLRQVVHVSLGGSRMRLRFSNAFGARPLGVAAAHVAVSAGGSAIMAATGRPLTFGGRTSIVIQPGDEAISDAIAFPLRPLSELTVTLALDGVPPEVTGHPGSRTTSYLQTGHAVADSALPHAATTEHWYVLSGIDVPAQDGSAAVVVLGNSITDGRGSRTDHNDRWPDNLARRLQADARTANVAVLNQGIGGNRVLRGGLGPPALARFDRDVLGRCGVRWLIVLEGVNDLGEARGEDAAATTARELIEAYRWMIRRAHERRIRVYGATILPFGGSFYEGPGREAARQSVNRFVRSGEFDAVIDMDAAMRDPAQPSRLRADGDGGDHLHPNSAGYVRMAEAVDLALFARSNRPRPPRDSGACASPSADVSDF